MIFKKCSGEILFLKGVISPKTRPDVIVRWSNFHGQKPLRNSRTSEPATSPVVPHFPRPYILEVIIQKNTEPGRNYGTIYGTIPNGNG